MSAPIGTACVLHWTEHVSEPDGDTNYSRYAFVDAKHNIIGKVYHGSSEAARIMARRNGTFTAAGNPGELN